MSALAEERGFVFAAGRSARIDVNVERACREFRDEPADKPWNSAKSFDLIDDVAKLQSRGRVLR